jgi:hypothetical protein
MGDEIRCHWFGLQTPFASTFLHHKECAPGEPFSLMIALFGAIVSERRCRPAPTANDDAAAFVTARTSTPTISRRCRPVVAGAKRAQHHHNLVVVNRLQQWLWAFFLVQVVGRHISFLLFIFSSFSQERLQRSFDILRPNISSSNNNMNNNKKAGRHHRVSLGRVARRGNRSP